MCYYMHRPPPENLELERVQSRLAKQPSPEKHPPHGYTLAEQSKNLPGIRHIPRLEQICYLKRDLEDLGFGLNWDNMDIDQLITYDPDEGPGLRIIMDIKWTKAYFLKPGYWYPKVQGFDSTLKWKGENILNDWGIFQRQMEIAKSLDVNQDSNNMALFIICTHSIGDEEKVSPYLHMPSPEMDDLTVRYEYGDHGGESGLFGVDPHGYSWLRRTQDLRSYLLGLKGQLKGLQKGDRT